MYYSFDYSGELYHIKEVGTSSADYEVDGKTPISPSYIYIVIKGNKDTGSMILNVIKSDEGKFSFIDTTIKTGGARKSRRNRKGRKARRTRKH